MKACMQKILIFIFSLSTTEALGTLEQIAPSKTGAQKEFSELLKNEKYEAALMSWSNAHGNSTFAKSDNGVALQAFLMAKTGLPTMASRWVLRDTNPKKLDKELKSEWISMLSGQIAANNINTDNSLWSKELSGFDTIKIKSKADVKKVQKQLAKTNKKDVNKLTSLYWSLVTQAPSYDYLNVAEGAVKSIRSLNQDLITDDQLHMALGRILFQKGQLNEAIVEYSQVSKASDQWLESLEEKAWALVRLNEYDKATSETTTLLAPVFKDLVGPEVYFLANLTALKICDYPRVLENGKKFSERNADRIREIEQLADRGTNSKINEILNRMDTKGVQLKSVGGDIKSWPRMALKSSSFTKPYNERQQLLAEISRAQSLKQNFSVVGENQSLNALISWAQIQSDRLKNEGLRALKNLAREEVKEFRTIINKLKLAEVEVIHHFNVDDSLKGKRSKIQNLSQGSDVLVFPYDDEVWVDELDNYQARVKDCPNSKGASL